MVQVAEQASYELLTVSPALHITMGRTASAVLRQCLAAGVLQRTVVYNLGD